VYELVKRDFFNKGLFDSFKILTSRGIQKRYIQAMRRRRKITLNRDFLALSEDDVYILNENVYIMSTSTPKNVDIEQQSKGKESKKRKKQQNAVVEIVDNFSGDEEKKETPSVFFKISQEESRALFSLVDAIGLQEDFNPKQFIFRCLKNNISIDITMMALNSLQRSIQKKMHIKNTWGYVTEIVKRQCEQRGIKATIEEHEKNKEEEREFARNFFKGDGDG